MGPWGPVGPWSPGTFVNPEPSPAKWLAVMEPFICISALAVNTPHSITAFTAASTRTKLLMDILPDGSACLPSTP
jgi:hypothetical protein